LKIGFSTITLSSKNLGIRPYQTQIQISLVPCALVQAFEGSEVEPGMPCKRELRKMKEYDLSVDVAILFTCSVIWNLCKRGLNLGKEDL
jgi:hypothetical protein